jgi:large repetitive protein
MSCLDQRWFKWICKLVLYVFFFQGMHPANFGYHPPPAPSEPTVPFAAWSFGPQAAVAQELPENDAESPSPISVGRTQSTYFVDQIEGNRLTITYGVFNQSAEEIDGVKLVTVLQSGVPFEEASPLPNRQDQQLTWDLGSVAPFSSAQVTLTVTLADLAIQQLDSGAEVSGTQDAQLVTATTSPAFLRTDTVDADDLKCTPDANCNDPYVLAKAAALGNDPQRIIEFVRNEIGYESYQGSLRGARGTLWSGAGNALDQASLLIALLRASGIPARYIEGALEEALAQELIVSMFPAPLRVVGCPPDDAVRADPSNDAELLAETQEHYWVEFDSGGGFTAVDPTFQDAEIDQTFATAQGGFSEVPDDLRHKVRVRLKAEFPSGLAGSAGFEEQTALNETFNTVELVGKPLTVGNFVSSYSPPALIFGYTAYTYSPYILVGQNDSDLSDDPIIRGIDYQEILTSFPFGSQVLTGLFLEMDVQSPDGAVETVKRTLIDRVGFDVRQNGGSITLGGEGPALSDLDLVTINALPGLQGLGAIAQQRGRVESLQAELNELQPQIDAIPSSGPQTAARLGVVEPAQLVHLHRERLEPRARGHGLADQAPTLHGGDGIRQAALAGARIPRDQERPVGRQGHIDRDGDVVAEDVGLDASCFQQNAVSGEPVEVGWSVAHWPIPYFWSRKVLVVRSS